jgi:hypothetical protein
MTAALTVGGLAGTMAPAHATGSACIDFPLISIVECNQVNALNHLVTVTISQVNVSLVTVKNVLNNNWVNIPIASGNAVEIETAVKDVLNNNNVLSCLINVTIVTGGSSGGNC